MRYFKSPICLSLLFIVFSLSFVACVNLSTSQKQSLTIKDAKSKWGNGISIQRVNAEVTITGNIAETTLDLTIYNSTKRTLEASLDLPLPEGASISRYALEVNGVMREGVIVDKEKGRVAFENTIRQNIDPGLLEKTQGNNFRTRIYPVPAKGTKRVLLSYTEPMSSYSHENYHYTLPLTTRLRVKQFNLRVASNHSTTQIIPTKKIGGYSALENGSYSFSKSNYRPSKLSFLITNSQVPNAVIQKGNDGRHYFYVSKQLTPKHKAYARKKIHNLHLLWDSSHSSRLRNHKAELDLLEHYFQYHQNVNVDLTFLSNTRSKKLRYVIVNGDFRALRSRLERTAYDGATRLDQLDLRGNGYDAVLYAGDGIATLGNSSVRSGSKPIFLINSSPQANHNLLKQLAKKTHGAYVNLVNNPLKHPHLSLITQPYQLLKVTGSGVAEVDFETRSNTASVVGRLLNSRTKLKLHYGIRGKILHSETISLNRSTQKRGGTLAAKLWAQAQVNQLSYASKKNKSRIIALAKAHHLVTDYTSLIVLDRISDYIRYRIVPPTKTLRKQYYQRLKTEEKSKQGSKANLNDVYTDWKEVRQWHQSKFPQKKKHSVKNAAMQGVSESGAMVLPSFSPPVSPSPVSISPRNSMTGGLRSGDFSISRDSIDAFLSNPNRPKSIGMKLKSWQPDTPYTRDLNTALQAGKQLFPVYLKWKKRYGASSGFYLDSAEIFLKNNQRTLAKQVLSNLAELNPESAALLRILAHRYDQMGEYNLAEMILRKVKDMRSEEPQSYRDLALVLAKRKRYTEASNLLWKIVTTEWDDRFDGIKMVVLNEWNQIMRISGKSATKSQRRFRYNIDADLRVVLTWDTDNSDMDLWVTEPNGEKCYYSNTLTRFGGTISQDFLDGRGPEAYMIRRSRKGKYKVQANYFGTREQTLTGPTTLQAKLITNWNRPNQQEKIITIRLGKDKEVIDIGEFSLKQ